LAVGAAAAVGLVLTGVFVVARQSGTTPTHPNAATMPLVPASPPLPPGVITYEVTGQGVYTTDSSARQRESTTYDHVHSEGQVATATDAVPSPDGKYRASLFHNAQDGVYLAITGPDGVQRMPWQLAGEFDPQLVAGGKSAARAVEGIPFVVAWSPDSQALAFGSITGEPYVLGVLRSPGSANPTLEFEEVRGGYIGELAWSPDGKYLAISTYSLDRRNHTVLIAAGGTGLVRTLIDGCHITWSPDSKYIAIHRDPGVEGGAWVVSATDKEDRWPISREEKAFPLTWRN
jgi:hypothetical protein